MKVAIMQPTYLPWIGYFALMESVDVFVILDDVQFSKQSWQQRNRVMIGGEAHFITVPVLRKESPSPLIRDILLGGDPRWKKKHLGLLRQHYSDAEHGKKTINIVEKAYEKPLKTIGALNCELISGFAEVLGISTKVVRSSAFELQGANVGRLLDIVGKLGADTYCSPQGSFGYIDEDNRFGDRGIALEYFKYEHPTYHQLGDQFISHLSIFDLVANEGSRSLVILKSGIRPPLSHEQVRKLQAD